MTKIQRRVSDMSEDGVACESLVSCFHYPIWTPIAIATANQTFSTTQIQIRIQNPIIFFNVYPNV